MPGPPCQSVLVEQRQFTEGNAGLRGRLQDVPTYQTPLHVRGHVEGRRGLGLNVAS